MNPTLLLLACTNPVIMQWLILFVSSGGDNESMDSYSMVGAKENMTIEEDADMDSKQWTINDSQVRYHSIHNSSVQSGL